MRARTTLLGLVVVACSLVAVAARQDPPYKPTKTVTYRTVEGRDLKLDLFLPKEGKPKGAILLIHGGGWMQGSPSQNAALTDYFQQQGFLAASVEYRFAPRDLWPAQAQDVEAAMRYLQTHANELGYDAKRIGVMGGSAGGHLTLWLATGNLGVKAALALCPPTDLTLPMTPTADQIVQTVLPKEDFEGGKRRMSPIFRIGPTTPPVMLMHGDQDELVPAAQSEAFAAAMKKAGRPVELLVLKGEKHSFDWGKPEILAAGLRSLRWLMDEIEK